ncbi:Zinc finger protein Pegasus [Frankliniella fusca]|uniref:Zinc finger protein Pegasus n=1 Tax=Frankliniella fusca TaxID=407009 RepID=A0AAE1LK12_9NEOP|nr:Zinc finger protein Pegasus [Frankliniella fusca]
MGDQDTWVLIQTPREFCIVLETAVIYTEELNVGDKCQYEAKRLVQLQKKKRESSFHEDKPRKATLRIRNTWSKPSQQKSAKLPSMAKQLKRAAQSREKEVARELFDENSSEKENDDLDCMVDSDMDTTDPMSESEPNEGDKSIITQEVQRDLNSSKLTKPASNSANRHHSNLESSVLKSFKSSSFTSSIHHCSTPSSGKPTGMKSRNEIDSTPESARNSSSSKSSSKPSLSKSQIISPAQPIRRSNCFDMDRMFIHNCESDLAVEVHEKTGIYCGANEYALADGASSATAVARRLMGGVFTLEALDSCFVTGLPPRGKGRLAYQDKQNIKPYLCPKGVNAIVCRAIFLQKMKHFTAKKDASQIRSAMGIKLNEIQQNSLKENNYVL